MYYKRRFKAKNYLSYAVCLCANFMGVEGIPRVLRGMSISLGWREFIGFYEAFRESLLGMLNLDRAIQRTSCFSGLIPLMSEYYQVAAQRSHLPIRDQSRFCVHYSNFEFLKQHAPGVVL